MTRREIESSKKRNAPANIESRRLTELSLTMSPPNGSVNGLLDFGSTLRQTGNYIHGRSERTRVKKQVCFDQCAHPLGRDYDSPCVVHGVRKSVEAKSPVQIPSQLRRIDSWRRQSAGHQPEIEDAYTSACFAFAPGARKTRYVISNEGTEATA